MNTFNWIKNNIMTWIGSKKMWRRKFILEYMQECFVILCLLFIPLIFSFLSFVDSDRDSGISPQHPMPPHGFSQVSIRHICKSLDAHVHENIKIAALMKALVLLVVIQAVRFDHNIIWGWVIKLVFFLWVCDGIVTVVWYAQTGSLFWD